MGALNRLAVVLSGALAPAVALLLAPSVHADEVHRWQPHIEEASARFGIPKSWIARVMRAESGGRTTRRGRPIRSSAGAMGLMQLMPRTWAEMRSRLGLGPDPDDPRDNILAGTLYLRLMYERFGYPGLFGAYNAGPARYAAYLAGQQSLPAETIAYLATVAGRATGGPIRPSAPPVPVLFAVRREGGSNAPAPAGPVAAPSLFAIRKAAR